MIYIGIDLGRVTGIAALHPSGAWLRKTFTSASTMDFDLQLFDILDSIDEGDTLCIIEQPPYVNNQQTFRQLCHYEIIAKLDCETLSIPCQSIQNSAIKLLTCGKGDSTKDEMLARACEILGKPIPKFKTKKARDIAQNGYDAVLCAYYGKLISEADHE